MEGIRGEAIQSRDCSTFPGGRRLRGPGRATRALPAQGSLLPSDIPGRGQHTAESSLRHNSRGCQLLDEFRDHTEAFLLVLDAVDRHPDLVGVPDRLRPDDERIGAKFEGKPKTFLWPTTSPL